MTQHTMSDLRREVAKRLRETLHGREIDTLERGMPELPHMLGIVTIGAISTDKATTGSLLDPEHDFWDKYYKDVQTKTAVEQEITSAMQSLKEDNIFRVTTPYGEEAGIMYCEVGDVDSPENKMMTVCTECGERIPTEPELTHNYGRYELDFVLDCPDCEFKEKIGSTLINKS